ncbi:MAG TPA: isoprenylcysteine carboxylmethyltransferase family protein [Sphingobacteriaceae bacterium]
MKTSQSQPTLLAHIRDIIILPFTVTVVVPYLIHSREQPFFSDSIILKMSGIIFFTFGLFLFFYTVYLFNTFGKGTLAPWAATRRLVVYGPYRYCRNPMITGVFCILIGETLFLHSMNLLFWSMAFFLINSIYFILKEEPDLEKRFGNDYKVYKENVPRWIPRLKAYSKS